jgi:hypothetical protein
MQVVSLTDERAMRTMSAVMKLFVVEFSVSEQAVMIRTLENVIKDNIRNVKKGLSKDYLPLGFFDSRAKADHFHAQLNIVLAENGALSFRGNDWQRIGEYFEMALESHLKTFG